MTNSDVANDPPRGAAKPAAAVYLVGAGPGDPGLLTLRGANLLALADVVVYDALANPALLKHCKQTTELIYVGKQAGSHSMTQEQINALLVESGQSGKTVVRLKGGDPFVFGRGGEECQALADAGIAFEVVPGITAAIAVPAYAGIPVTHRDLNSSFTFITGHEKEETNERPSGDASDLDWTALAKLPCLAFYMGVRSLPRIVQRLIEHGMDPSTPAATIHRGTTPQQRTVVAPLRDLPAAAANLAPPALTIIGRVVSLRDTLNWFERRPLFGKTIIVTRSRQQASDLSQRLSDLGAAVLEQPTIELTPPANPSELDDLLQTLAIDAHKFDWIVFTSANAVTHLRRRLLELKLDVRALGNARIAAVGDATAAAITEQLCRQVDLSPKQFTADALADALQAAGEVTNRRFLLLRADIGRPALLQRLRAGGAVVHDQAIYENRPVTKLSPEVAAALRQDQVDWITFTSSSTAKNFLAMPGSQWPTRIRCVSIGPMTSATLGEAGVTPMEAPTHDIAGMVAAILTSER